MAVKADPTTAAQAWVSGMQGASAKYTAGVQAVKTAPGVLAANAADLWAQNVANAKAKYAKNVAAVSLSAWQAAAVNKGAARLGTGASASADKMQAFMSKFIPQLGNVVSSLPARGSFDQNLNRLTSYIQGVHQLKGTF